MPRERTSNDPKEVLSGREKALRRIEDRSKLEREDRYGFHSRT